MVAEEWGVCGAGFACARAEQLMLRYRNVWCADAVACDAKKCFATCCVVEYCRTSPMQAGMNFRATVWLPCQHCAN